MVEIFVYSILLLIAYSVGAYQSRRSYTLGLKHNYELSKGITPSEEKNVLEKVIERNREVKQEKEQQSIIDEWLNGESHRG